MQDKIKELLKSIGLPVTLAAVIASVAAVFGLDLDRAVQLFGVLAGMPFVIGLVVDLLKLVGVVTPGTSGKWSAALNLISIIGLAVVLKFAPTFDVTGWDAQLLELAKALALIVTWVAQLFGTRSAHRFYTNGLGVDSFRFSILRAGN